MYLVANDHDAVKTALDDYVYARMGSAGLIRTAPSAGKHGLSADRAAEEGVERLLNALVPVVGEAIARGIQLDAP
jgi:hypothetical protein